MASYATLKAAISAAIKQNGNNEITGILLQQQLLAMVNSLGVGYQYVGIATPNTNPGTPDQNVFYIASTAGTYANFGGLTLADGEIAILKYNGTWSKDLTGAVTQKKINQQFFELNGIRYEFEINKYISNYGNINPLDGWALSHKIDLIENGVIRFAPNQLNYYLYIIDAFDENNNFLGAIFVSAGYQYEFPVNLILESYPTAKYVYIDLWGGSTHAALTETDVADWDLTQGSENAVIPQMKNAIGNNTNEIESLKNSVGSYAELGVVLNNYYSTSGLSSNLDGWARTTRTALLDNSIITFGENALNYVLWMVFAWDANGQFLGFAGTEEWGNVGRHKVTAEQLKERFPGISEFSFDIWGGAAHAALTLADVADWVVAQSIPGRIDREIEAINEEIADIENEISGATKPNLFHCDITPGATSHIISPFNSSYNLKTYFKIRRPSSVNGNPVFNFESVSLVNKQSGAETSVHSCSDDICPANYNNTYIGANHADSDCRLVTANNHGKTAVDIGSIWANGAAQCTLVGIQDANTLVFMGQNTLQYPKFTFNTNMFGSGVVLTHVSGATHTGNITIGSSTMKQWYSSMIADVSIFVDDEQIFESGDYRFNKLRICERYDVLNPASVVEKIREKVGTFTETPNPNSMTDADKVVRHSIVYEFDAASEWRIATTFVAFQDINIDYFGFTQQGAMGGDIKMYIPKALPISNGQETIDFRTIVPYNSVPQTMNLTADYWENPQLPPDRWLQIGPYVALHSGYLFDYGVGGNNRKDNINNAFFLYTSRKCYPHGIDSKLTISGGDTFTAVVWRSYKDAASVNTGGLICANIFEYAGDCYIYADFKAAGLYELDIPAKFTGREIQVFEKRSNVELLTPLSNSKILVSVTSGTPMYGYLVAKIKG